MAMAATGMARHIFRQPIGLKERNILSNGTFLCLKHTHARTIELLQRPAANASNNDCINLMPAEPGNRIACAVLMNFVAVVNCRDLVGNHINYDK